MNLKIAITISSTLLAFAALSASGAQPPIDPGSGTQQASPRRDHDQPITCTEPVEGCGCALHTTVCHDLCTPYSENGCFLCSTRTYYVCQNGKHVGDFDGELVIVCQYDKVDCFSTC